MHLCLCRGALSLLWINKTDNVPSKQQSANIRLCILPSSSTIRPRTKTAPKLVRDIHYTLSINNQSPEILPEPENKTKIRERAHTNSQFQPTQRDNGYSLAFYTHKHLVFFSHCVTGNTLRDAAATAAFLKEKLIRPQRRRRKHYSVPFVALKLVFVAHCFQLFIDITLAALCKCIRYYYTGILVADLIYLYFSVELILEMLIEKKMGSEKILLLLKSRGAIADFLAVRNEVAT